MHAIHEPSHFPKMILRVASAVLMLAVTGAAAASADIGSPAPEFTLPDTKGSQHTLADLRGSYVVLEWTNHQCPFVRKHYGSGNMQSLQKEYTSDGVVWLSIISSAPGEQGYVSAEEADELTLERKASPSAVLLDPEGKVGKLYDARTTPHMYVIDPNGTLIYKGGIDDKPSTRLADIDTATNYVRVALTEAKSGQTVSNPVTRPYGCSVKYAY